MKKYGSLTCYQAASEEEKKSKVALRDANHSVEHNPTVGISNCTLREPQCEAGPAAEGQSATAEPPVPLEPVVSFWMAGV